MFTSRDLKAIITEVRPIVERQLDDAVIVAGFRETVTAQGGDWSQVKALVKAMIQDERDEAGGHKRVLAILHKADHALGYADMLGLGNLNEKNSFEDEPEHDAETGEITKSTAARKEVRESSARGDAHQSHSREAKEHETRAEQAGTQAPPVDTTNFISAFTIGQPIPQPEMLEPSDPLRSVAATRKDAVSQAGDTEPGTTPPVTPQTVVPVASDRDSAIDAATVPVAASNVTAFKPARRQWRHDDAPDPRCAKPHGPTGCGGFSNLGLCQTCKEAAGLPTSGAVA